MYWHHKRFGTKFRCLNILSLNYTEVFAETKSFLNKFHIYVHVSSVLIPSIRTIVTCQNTSELL